MKLTENKMARGGEVVTWENTPGKLSLGKMSVKSALKNNQFSQISS